MIDLRRTINAIGCRGTNDHGAVYGVIDFLEDKGDNTLKVRRFVSIVDNLIEKDKFDIECIMTSDSGEQILLTAFKECAFLSAEHIIDGEYRKAGGDLSVLCREYQNVNINYKSKFEYSIYENKIIEVKKEEIYKDCTITQMNEVFNTNESVHIICENVSFVFKKKGRYDGFINVRNGEEHLLGCDFDSGVWFNCNDKIGMLHILTTEDREWRSVRLIKSDIEKMLQLMEEKKETTSVKKEVKEDSVENKKGSCKMKKEEDMCIAIDNTMGGKIQEIRKIKDYYFKGKTKKAAMMTRCLISKEFFQRIKDGEKFNVLNEEKDEIYKGCIVTVFEIISEENEGNFEVCENVYFTFDVVESESKEVFNTSESVFEFERLIGKENVQQVMKKMTNGTHEVVEKYNHVTADFEMKIRERLEERNISIEDFANIIFPLASEPVDKLIDILSGKQPEYPSSWDGVSEYPKYPVAWRGVSLMEIISIANALDIDLHIQFS